jgi:hypothetical protein
MNEYDGRKENVWVKYVNYYLLVEKKKRTLRNDKTRGDTERKYSHQSIYASLIYIEIFC